MTGAQSRIADTLATFYNAADRTSDGAMAAHAYKQSVNDFDAGIQRELVRSCRLFLRMTFSTHTYLSRMFHTERR
jgi:hypothetical protein